MPPQTFAFFHGSRSVVDMQSRSVVDMQSRSVVDMPSDFNQRPYGEILALMQATVKEHNLDPTQRYVAVGSYGDCVILENGEVLLVSDAA